MKNVTFIIFFAIWLALSSCSIEEKNDYHEDGSLKSRYYLDDGQIQGLKTDYSKKGDVIIETEFESGKKNGVQKYYYSNGMAQAITEFKNDKEHGLQEIFYESGALQYQVRFSNGLRADTSYFFDPEGRLGELKVYNDLGEIAYLEKYDDGELTLDSVIPLLHYNRDSVPLGAVIEVKVDLTFPVQNDVDIEFGKVFKDENRRDTVFVMPRGQSSVSFQFETIELGLNQLYVKVIDENNAWPDKTANGVITKLNVTTYNN